MWITHNRLLHGGLISASASTACPIRTLHFQGKLGSRTHHVRHGRDVPQAVHPAQGGAVASGLGKEGVQASTSGEEGGEGEDEEHEEEGEHGCAVGLEQAEEEEAEVGQEEHGHGKTDASLERKKGAHNRDGDYGAGRSQDPAAAHTQLGRVNNQQENREENHGHGESNANMDSISG